MAVDQASKAGNSGHMGDLGVRLLTTGRRERAVDWQLSHQPHSGFDLLTCYVFRYLCHSFNGDGELLCFHGAVGR
jgi:hypothetical protein